mgnify:CR=1 FL=1
MPGQKLQRYGSKLHPQCFTYNIHILIAVSTQVDHNNLLLIQRACHFGRVGYGVGWFECWNNAFGLAEKLESFQRLLIIYCYIGGASNTLVVTMLRSYSRIIQAG